MATDCLFCKICDGQLPSKRVFEDDLAIAFEDANPQAPTHVLVVPRRHIATLNDLGPSDRELVGHLVAIATRIAKDRGLAENGYRTLFNCNREAGQTVFHVHLHLLGGRKFRWPPG
jgi:histidine triad (HIT) family protein